MIHKTRTQANLVGVAVRTRALLNVQASSDVDMEDSDAKSEQEEAVYDTDGSLYEGKGSGGKRKGKQVSGSNGRSSKRARKNSPVQDSEEVEEEAETSSIRPSMCYATSVHIFPNHGLQNDRIDCSNLQPALTLEPPVQKGRRNLLVATEASEN